MYILKGFIRYCYAVEHLNLIFNICFLTTAQYLGPIKIGVVLICIQSTLFIVHVKLHYEMLRFSLI